MENLSKTQINHLSRLKDNHSFFSKIAKDHLTEEFLITSVKETWRGKVVEHFDQEGMTPKFLEKVVKANPHCLEYIKNKTPLMCKVAISFHKPNIEYVPKEMITYELASLALTKRVGDYLVHHCLLQFIPQELIDYNLCLKAVEQNGLNVQYVPLEFQTPELLKVAVLDDGNSLSFIKNQTTELCLLGFTEDSNPIEHVLNKNYEIYFQMVKTKPKTFKDVPVKFRDDKMCMMAVKSDGLNLEYCPRQSFELCRIAVENNVYAFNFCFYRDEEMLLSALKKDGSIIKTIANATDYMIEIAIDEDPFNIILINQDRLSPKMFMRALKKINKKNLSSSNKVRDIVQHNNHQDLKFCLLALSIDESSYSAIDLVKWRDKKECLAEIKNLMLKRDL